MEVRTFVEQLFTGGVDDPEDTMKSNSSLLNRSGVVALMSMLCFVTSSRIGHSAETKTRSQTIKFGVPFKIGLQKSVALPDGKTAFIFASLNDDSRCPAGRECVWEGEVKTTFSLRRAEKSLGKVNLTLRGRNRVIAKSSAYVKPYRIKLLRVDPYPGEANSAATPIQATVVIETKPAPVATGKPNPTPTPVPQPVRK